MLSSGILWNIPQVTWFFSVYTRSFRRVCIQRKIKSSRYTTRKHYITNLFHATLTHHDSVNELLNHYFTLFDFVFLFDLWFQEFQIKAKTRVFFFHFLVVYTKILFACQDSKAAPLSGGKIWRPRRSLGFFREYDPFDIAE